MSTERHEFRAKSYLMQPTKISSHEISIGAFSVIEATTAEPSVFGRGVTLGHHVTIAASVTLEDNVEVRSYGSVGFGSKLGSSTKLLYGGAVYHGVEIGKNCIIGGSVDTGTIVGDDVTFLGKIVHNYRTPGTFDQLTDGVPSPSPRIRDRAVVGEGALLFGDIEIGEGAYVAAGMIVKCNVPPGVLYCEQGFIELSRFHGFVAARERR